MRKIKTFGGAAAALLLVCVGVGVGYLIWGYRGTPEAPPPDTWRVSQRTAGGTAEPLEKYERRIAELEEALEQRDAELLAAVQADFVALPTTTVYGAEIPEGQSDVLAWEWTERGGGTGLADFARRDVTMNWNPWAFAVDVELTRERDGRLGATVSTDEPGLELAQTKFYADDPWKKRWFEKFNAGVAGGYGDGITLQGHVGWSGWNVYVQHDRDGEAYMVGRDWKFF